MLFQNLLSKHEERGLREPGTFFKLCQSPLRCTPQKNGSHEVLILGMERKEKEIKLPQK